MQSSSRHKKRLIVTLQLKNAEVYPGSNLHGTVILQLMHKHHHSHHHRDRTHSFDSVETRTPSASASASVDPHFHLNPHLLGSSSSNKNRDYHVDPSLIVIDSVSVSVAGLCKINSLSEQSHFPLHLRDESSSFNILRGKENVLGHGLKLKENSTANLVDHHRHRHDPTQSVGESVQFDFVVQLPPILPCSYSGYFIEYQYFAQLIVSLSKHSEPTKCRVPFYVLPLRPSNHGLSSSSKSSKGSGSGYNEEIPRLLTPLNLQERMSVFRKRRKFEDKSCWTPSTPVIAEDAVNHHNSKMSLTVSPDGHPQLQRGGSSSSSVSSFAPSPRSNVLYNPTASMLFPSSTDHRLSIDHQLSSTTFTSPQRPLDGDDHEHIGRGDGDKLYYLRRNSLTLNYRDSNSLHDVDADGDDEHDFDLKRNRHHHQNQNRFRICLEAQCLGTLLLSDTVFCDGQSIDGYLSLFTPAVVRVALVHEERCGPKQRHFTNCCATKQCCWFTPSMAFKLKIPNNAFKSFRGDLVESGWALHFQFAISKRLLLDKEGVKAEELGYLNMSNDVWSLWESNHPKKDSKKTPRKVAGPQIDKILKWQLPIIVTTVHNRLRCVTRSNAVVIKC